MKIAIITEIPYEQTQLKKLTDQGVVVNYTLLPEYYNSYAEEINKINNALVWKAKGIIFKIGTFYAGTKEAIEKALYYKKPIKIIFEDKEYKLNTLEEWKSTTGYGRQAKTFKHPLLQIYEDQRREYFDKQKQKRIEYQTQQATQGVTLPEEEVKRFVEQFHYLYDIEVDFNDTASVYLAYKSIQFYVDNDIEYANPPQSTEDEFPFEIISFGDLTYMEDFIYKNKEVEPCMQ